MPAIADQVSSLEFDHANALAQIESLTAEIEALTSAHSNLSAQHDAVLAENDALNKYADEIRTMVESVATGALKMLHAARAPIIPVTADKPVAAAIAGDSGDEQPAARPTLVPATPWPTRALDAVEAAVRSAPVTVESAVDRMLHHSAASSGPPITKIRAPEDMTMIVEHTSEGLPMFLRRGTVFDDMARARLAT